MASIDLGMVTAYAYAVAGGYTGSEQDFEDLLGNIASDLEEIENLSVTVTTLPEGSQATASYNNGVLSLGIPKGDTGATGAEGPEGPTGPTGNGIQSIAKTATSGNVDTYTITYTNGQTTTFTVTNGSVTSVDGQTGDVDLSNKANIDGYYEDLTAGYAENLISNVYDEENVPYNFRPAGGSLDIGAFEYDEIVGGSLPVNQLVANGNFASVSDWTAVRCSYTASSNIANITTNTASSECYLQQSYVSEAGHKYLILADMKCGTASSVKLLAYYNGTANNASKDQTSTNWGQFGIVVANSTAGNNLIRIRVYGETNGATFSARNCMLIDLTLMFGSTIADYIYTLEQGQAGAGVAWFKKLFPKDYYPYNTGELMHVQTSGHKMVGFNQWDEEWEVGMYDTTTGAKVTGSRVRSKNYINSLPSMQYYGMNDINYIYCYDADKNYLGRASYARSGSGWLFTTLANTRFMTFDTVLDYGTTYNNDICINLHWDGERDGEYEAYSEHTYPLDSDLVLRGIPKLDSANKLYYDGDTYEADGTVTRKYGIVDLGTLNWGATSEYGNVYRTQVAFSEAVQSNRFIGFKAPMECVNYTPSLNVTDAGAAATANLIGLAYGYLFVTFSEGKTATEVKNALNGEMFLYQLATPTTETADTFQSPQAVSNWGTEEYIDTRSIPIPVGHNTKYPPDLKAKLETSPNPPDADGDYIVRQTNGVNEYVALSTNATIQNIISRLEALEG